MDTPRYVGIFLICLFMFPGSRLAAQPNPATHFRKVMDSGGNLLREQAAYDVQFYRLKISIDTTTKSIAGSALVRALALDTLSVFVLDLSSNFTVDSVAWRGHGPYGSALKFTRPSGQIWISLPFLIQKSDTISLEVSYRGKPKISQNPPWDDGFVWKRAKTGEVWAGVACEEEGADVWWPCKDHPSDEPDSVDLYFTVPASLTCVSNGRLLGVSDLGNSKVFHWYVSEPINNYCVTFYLGPLQRIPVYYQSVTGEIIPSEYWFLPYNVDTAKKYTATFLKDLRFFEEVCGPFPFRAEKYSIVDAPYWGMEHQTCIAYGNNFVLNSYGFDYIHLHELAHEPVGNLVTAKDWSDVWIHEGFATYMEALFVEHTSGFTRYKTYMAGRRNGIQNDEPVAPNVPATAQAMFSSVDVYYKGAWILHTLRHYVGDQTFFTLLHRLTYPDPAMESVTNGKQCWLASTNDYLRIAEQVTGLKLDWFFNVYLRQPTLPVLRYSRRDTLLSLQWVTPNNLPFFLPVDVRVGGDTVKVDMRNGTGVVTVPAGISYQIDPNAWILMQVPQVVDVADDVLPKDFTISVFPNPFNPSTTLRLGVPKRMLVHGEIISVAGQRIAELLDKWFDPGTHSVPINLGSQSSGVYFVVVSGGERTLVRKLVLLK